MDLRRVTLGLIIALYALFPAAYVARAEGPGTGGRRIRLDDERAGPYLVRAVTSPTPPRVMDLYIEIRVIDASTQKIQEDLEILVIARPSDGGGEVIDAMATHDIAPIPNEYAAHLPVSRPGVWEISILIEGPSGPGQIAFLERVLKPATISPLLSVGAPFGGLIILGIVFYWLQRQSERDEKASA